MIKFDVESNVSSLDLLSSKALAFKMANISVIFKTTENWIELGLSYLSTKKNFTARFRDGETKTYADTTDVFNDAVIKYLVQSGLVKIKKNKVSFLYHGRKITLEGSLDLHARLVLENFFRDQYRKLGVEGSPVLDIGANIGDTPIYFALGGAKRVYAPEPYPYSYKLASRNIRLNGLSEKVEIINEACGGRNGSVRVDPNFKNQPSLPLMSSSKGKRIRMESLESLTRRYGLNDAVLKVDCEGYEYEIILKSPRDTLRKFARMMVEYHYGYRNIEEKLKTAGFAVRHTKPIFTSNALLSRYGMLRGIIYAERRP
jgi:FkbM family methyltransferase